MPSIVAVLYLFAVFNCLRILRQRHSTPATFAWLFFHLTTPFIAIPVYYLIGQNRIRGYEKRRKKTSDQFAHETEHNFLVSLDSVIRFDDDPNDRTLLKQFGHTFSRYGEVFLPTANQLSLLINGEETFLSIFDELEKSQSYILVQYYILRADRLGIALKELLIRKSKQNIPIFVLYDDMGSFWLTRQYINQLRAAGIKTACFLPVAKISRFFQINFRNHRKLVIVDGKVAFTGGLNVGEEYIGKIGQIWRDTHVKIEGPAVKQLEEIFLEDWHFASKGNSQILPAQVISNASHKHSDKFTNLNQRIQVIPSGPTDEDLIAVYLFMQVIESSESRLWIATPYFIPNDTLLKMIELASLRGVDVRILIPGMTTKTPTQWASLYYLEELAKKGVKVFTYDPGFMHQKVIVVDDHLTVMGSSNIDNRTLYYNFETTILCHDKEFTGKVANMLTEDFAKSSPLCPQSSLNFRTRFRRNLSRLLSPLL